MGYYLMSFFFLFSFYSLAQQQIKISLDSKKRVYEGIGALSAGASSRLLIDYEEPYRSDILDYLFKPNFGASLQHLKVEIGGDVNSTSGTEPSHARNCDEFRNPKSEYFERGYEWWLMKEAKKRNPNIIFDILEWGAPGWIGNGKFYSDDNINYVISFIKGMKKYHDLDIEYVGIWNERMYNTEYIKHLRKSLNDSGLSFVKIVAADQTGSNVWKICGELLQDSVLKYAVHVVGEHYIERETNYKSPISIQNINCPIWNSEGGPWKGDWIGFEELSKLYNRGYIEGKITKNITWSLITSYYDNLALPNSGLMKANSPWSGYYQVEPAVWAVAHTTQFVKPGWYYIDDGCGYLENGSFVTLSDELGENFSVIIETMGASMDQNVTIRLDGFKRHASVSCWKSVLRGVTFQKQKNIPMLNNQLSLVLEPNALYTISTTEGQCRGNSFIPEQKSFPIPYMTGFEQFNIGSSPAYFADQGGAFEVSLRIDGKGRCLRQMITQPCIEWEGAVLNQTIIGDTAWTDYSVSTDLCFNESYSNGSLLARVTETYRSHKPADAYRCELNSSGHWFLYAREKILSSGWLPVDLGVWYNLSLILAGKDIEVYLDGRRLCKVNDSTFTHGMAGLGSSFHIVDFDNFQIK